MSKGHRYDPRNHLEMANVFPFAVSSEETDTIKSYIKKCEALDRVKLKDPKDKRAYDRKNKQLIDEFNQWIDDSKLFRNGLPLDEFSTSASEYSEGYDIADDIDSDEESVIIHSEEEKPTAEDSGFIASDNQISNDSSDAISFTQYEVNREDAEEEDEEDIDTEDFEEDYQQYLNLPKQRKVKKKKQKKTYNEDLMIESGESDEEWRTRKYKLYKQVCYICIINIIFF